MCLRGCLEVPKLKIDQCRQMMICCMRPAVAALAFRIVQDLVDLKADHHHLARRAATLDEQVNSHVAKQCAPVQQFSSLC